MTQSPSPQQEIQQQAGKILSQVAGYVGVKTMEIGLRSGRKRCVGCWQRPIG